MTKLLLALTAALGLTISAQAHLGWTLQDCIDHWGNYQATTNADGDPIYVFIDPASKMSIGCIFYSDHVESISYISSNDYAKLNADAILGKNGGGWQVYDDGRGRQTVCTWKQLDTLGQLAQYAVLTRLSDGGYRLQISTAGYGAWLDSKHGNTQPVSNSALTNI
jgi:hypothetical protein